MLLKGNRSCKMKKNEKIDLVYKLCRYVVDTLFWGCMVMALFVVMQIFLFSSFKIPEQFHGTRTDSGDYVLVNKLIPGARLIQRFRFFAWRAGSDRSSTGAKRDKEK